MTEARHVTLILTDTVVGDGRVGGGDPIRHVYQLFTFDGVQVAEFDVYRDSEEKPVMYADRIATAYERMSRGSEKG